MTHVKVYPAKASAMNVRHPGGALPNIDGAEWPNDVFTFRRLTDGSFTTDAEKAFKPSPAAAAKAPASPIAADAGPDIE